MSRRNFLSSLIFFCAVIIKTDLHSMWLLKKPVGIASYYLSSSQALFMKAVKEGDVRAARRFAQKSGVSVNIADKNGNRPLYIACKNHDLKMVEMLLKNGAKYSVNVPNKKDKDTPLRVACASHLNNRLKIVKLLIKYGGVESINMPGKYGAKPLEYACWYNGDINLVKFLVEHGADVSGLSLKRACQKNKLEVVEFLLQNGARSFVNMTGRYDKETPLYSACRNNNLDMVKLLLDNGAVIKKNIPIEHSPIHQARMHNNETMIKVLLDSSGEKHCPEGEELQKTETIVERNDEQQDDFESVTDEGPSEEVILIEEKEKLNAGIEELDKKEDERDELARVNAELRRCDEERRKRRTREKEGGKKSRFIRKNDNVATLSLYAEDNESNRGSFEVKNSMPITLIIKHDTASKQNDTDITDKSEMFFQESKLLSNKLLEKVFELSPRPIKKIIRGYKNFALYEEDLPKKIILHGPHGTGKSTMACMIAQKINKKCFFVNTGLIGNTYKNSEKDRLKKIFYHLVTEKAEQTENGNVIILDEADDIAKKKNENGTRSSIPSAIALLEDLFKDNEKILFIWTTNYITDIDPKLTDRSNRIGAIVEVPLPNLNARKEILDYYKETSKVKLQVASSLINAIAKKTGGFSIRSLKSLFCEARFSAKTRAENLSANVKQCVLLKKDFDDAYECVKESNSKTKCVDKGRFGKIVKERVLPDIATNVGTALVLGGCKYSCQKIKEKMCSSKEKKKTTMDHVKSAGKTIVKELGPIVVKSCAKAVVEAFSEKN